MRQISGPLALVLLVSAAPRAASQDATLEPGERFEGKVAYPLDEDRVEFPVLAGARVTLKAAATAGAKTRPRVVLLSDGEPVPVPHGHAKVKKKGALHKLKRVPVAAGGTFEAVVTGHGGKLGGYELTVQEFLPETAKEKLALAPGAAAVVPFVGRAGTVAQLVVAAKKKGAPLSWPTLRAPSGATVDLTGLVASSSDGRRLEIGPVVLPETGVHQVEVGNASAEAEKVKVRVELDHVVLTGGVVVEAPGQASMSGSVTLVDGSWTPGAGATSQSFADGEVLVRVQSPAEADAVAAALGVTVAARAPNGWARLRSPGAAPGAPTAGSARRVAELVRRARGHAAVLEAQPNHRRGTFAPPNDVMYAQQWDLPRIRMEEAWAVTSGDVSRCVAVLDTGVRFEHPDLAGRLLPGYDFVDEAWNAGDGNGIDADPTDVFLSLGTHGTHVIGTVAAGFDNVLGVAGAVPQVSVLPVRVLGVLGGTDFDIAQGILYAAGLPNVSNQLPPVAAEVINMSLGGPNPSEILHQAIRDAAAAGVVVVAAAGNAGTTKPFYPAAYPEVLTVGATDVLDGRAGYSSYGDHVDLVAPGGDKEKDLDQNGQLDGVLSTIVDPHFGPTYALKSGTSMAAPHVAAAAFLLRCAVPGMPVAMVDAVLSAAAVDLGAEGADPEFGAGRIDVAAALEVALGTAVGPPDPYLHEAPLRFAGHQSDLPLALVNRGGGAIDVSDVTSDASWLVPQTTVGTAPCLLDVHVEKTGLPPGEYAASLTVETSVGPRTVPVEMEVTADGPVPITTVHVLAIDVTTGEIVRATSVTEQTADLFSLDPLPEGTYQVVAVTDLDLDGVAGEAHDYAGVATSGEGAQAGLPLPDGATLAGLVIEVMADAPSVLPGGGDLLLPDGS